MKKAETLEHWRSLEPGREILKEMVPIPYKSSGSSYGSCGIRIDGTPAFIDAVLSNLKDLIDGENQVTRLELARTEVDGSSLGKDFTKAVKHAQVCYIRLHMRGREGAIVSALLGEHKAATERMASLYGL